MVDAGVDVSGVFGGRSRWHVWPSGCSPSLITALLETTTTKKNRMSEARRAPVQRLEIPEICMNNVTNASGIWSKECASSEEIPLQGRRSSLVWNANFLGFHGPSLPVSPASAEGYLRRP